MRKKTAIKRIVIALLLLIVLPLAILYIWSTSIIDKTYSIPLTEVYVPNDPASIKEGERLVHIAHCDHCHGDKWAGGIQSAVPYEVQYIAPNLSKVVPGYTNEELARLIREGIKKNGQSVYVMPSFMYHEIKDQAVGKMIAYLRTIQPIPSPPNVPASTSWYPLGRFKIIEGKILSIAATMDHHKNHFNPSDTSHVTFGRYLVTCGCTSCHGTNLKGRKGFSPDLIIATLYSRGQFLHLLHTGEGGLGRKNVGMMSEVARNNLCYLNDNEMNAIYEYLQTSPSQKN